jgi:hypothetical protein
MLAVVVLVVMGGVLLAVGLAFAWQEARPTPEKAVVYGVEDALEYVYPRLSEAGRAAVSRKDVRRILEWEVKYLQNPAVRPAPDEPTVVAGINAARYAQQRLIDAGIGVDGPVLLEVLERQAEYLAAIGAVGDPVQGPERDAVLEAAGEDPDA